MSAKCVSVLNRLVLFLFLDCAMNVHHKCQDKVANLCGINQKLLAEALTQVSQVSPARQSQVIELTVSLGVQTNSGMHNNTMRIQTQESFYLNRSQLGSLIHCNSENGLKMNHKLRFLCFLSQSRLHNII